MAAYFTQFSCMFDVGTADNVTRALAIYEEQTAALDEDKYSEPGFAVEPDPDAGPGMLWISSDGHGEPEHVIAFALACAEAFHLQGRWGFTWALTCSKPRLDGFAGGAQLLDLGARKSLAWTDCDHWLVAMLDPDPDPDAGIALA
ncbi:MAG: hypothetical protein JOY99_03750 [Sphingomonadaceae bacterium]|nr:hypothetical protein [Sphingomonadaceae bacterium]